MSDPERSAKSMRSDRQSYPKVPDEFIPYVLNLPECSYGAVRVTLRLRSGRSISNVILGGSEIAKVGDKLVRTHADIDFEPSEIVGVTPG